MRTGDTPLHDAARRSQNPEIVKALLAVSDPMARNSSGKTPWDLVQDNSALKGSEAYWRMNDARFDAGSGSADTSSAGTSVKDPRSDNAASTRQDLCEIPRLSPPRECTESGTFVVSRDGGFSGARLCAAGGWGAVCDCDRQLFNP